MTEYIQMALEGVSIPLLAIVLYKLRFVELQVSNHIPTSIRDLRARVDVLYRMQGEKDELVAGELAAHRDDGRSCACPNHDSGERD